uniref:Uncharacterized protein n=1 Tax=Trichogramma kaykai TaxID=54128 RepID=A0ABD2XHG4_9HYME
MPPELIKYSSQLGRFFPLEIHENLTLASRRQFVNKFHSHPFPKSSSEGHWTPSTLRTGNRSLQRNRFPINDFSASAKHRLPRVQRAAIQRRARCRCNYRWKGQCCPLCARVSFFANETTEYQQHSEPPSPRQAAREREDPSIVSTNTKQWTVAHSHYHSDDAPLLMAALYIYAHLTRNETAQISNDDLAKRLKI